MSIKSDKRKARVFLWIKEPRLKLSVHHMLNSRQIPVDLGSVLQDAKLKFDPRLTKVVILQMQGSRGDQREFISWCKQRKPSVKFMFLMDKRPAGDVTQELLIQGVSVVPEQEGLSGILWKMLELYRGESDKNLKSH
jgi:hypothetical protein